MTKKSAMFLQIFTRISPLISTESYYLIFAELFSFTELAPWTPKTLSSN